MFSRVLVPWDGEECNTALEVGVNLARNAGTGVDVLVREDAGGDNVELRELDEISTVLSAESQVSIALDTLERKRFFTDAVISELRNRPGSLMCMPSRGHGRWALLTGSLTTEVLVYSPGPVVLCGPECDADAFDRGGPILAALDGTPGSEVSIPLADEWAVGFDRTVEVVTVLPSRPSPELAAALASGEVAEGRYLANVVRADPGLRTHHAIFDVLYGDPAPAIAGEAEHRDASLIVMASSAPLGLDRFIHGSTTDDVVRTSSRPVLALKKADEWPS